MLVNPVRMPVGSSPTRVLPRSDPHTVGGSDRGVGSPPPMMYTRGGATPPPARSSPWQSQAFNLEELYVPLGCAASSGRVSQHPTGGGLSGSVHVPDLHEHVWHHSMRKAAAAASVDAVHTRYINLGCAAGGAATPAAAAQSSTPTSQPVAPAHGDTAHQAAPNAAQAWSVQDAARLAAGEGRLAFFSNAEQLADAVRQPEDLHAMLAALEAAVQEEGEAAADLQLRKAGRQAEQEGGAGQVESAQVAAATRRHARGADQAEHAAHVAAPAPLWKVHGGGSLQGHLILAAAKAAAAGQPSVPLPLAQATAVLQPGALGAIRQHAAERKRARRIQNAAVEATWGRGLRGEGGAAVDSLGDLVLAEAVAARLLPALLHATARKVDTLLDGEVAVLVQGV